MCPVHFPLEPITVMDIINQPIYFICRHRSDPYRSKEPDHDTPIPSRILLFTSTTYIVSQIINRFGSKKPHHHIKPHQVTILRPWLRESPQFGDFFCREYQKPTRNIGFV